MCGNEISFAEISAVSLIVNWKLFPKLVCQSTSHRPRTSSIKRFHIVDYFALARHSCFDDGKVIPPSFPWLFPGFRDNIPH